MISFDKVKNDNKIKHYRLDLDYHEYDFMLKMLNELKLEKGDFEPDGRFEENKPIAHKFFKKVQNIKQIEHGKKQTATRQANRSKIIESKKKINNAINLLRLECREITAYNVAQTAGISYNTAKKYLPDII
jgi:predicted HTH transcriptional regulator